MDIIQAIKERHSVRAYTGKKIEEEKRRKLEELIKAVSYTHLDVYKRQQ